MTYSEPPETYPDIKARKTWLDIPGLRFLLAGVYILLGFSGREVARATENFGNPPLAQSRIIRRRRAFSQRKPSAPSRNLSGLRPLVPNSTGGELSRTQFLERCTRLSVMGRFQIYDFLYYRHEFKRKSAMRRAPKGVMIAARGSGLHSFRAGSAGEMTERQIPP